MSNAQALPRAKRAAQRKVVQLIRGESQCTAANWGVGLSC